MSAILVELNKYFISLMFIRILSPFFVNSYGYTDAIVLQLTPVLWIYRHYIDWVKLVKMLIVCVAYIYCVSFLIKIYV